MVQNLSPADTRFGMDMITFWLLLMGCYYCTAVRFYCNSQKQVEVRQLLTGVPVRRSEILPDL